MGRTRICRCGCLAFAFPHSTNNRVIPAEATSLTPLKCHPERSSSRTLRTAQSKDLRFPLFLPVLGRSLTCGPLAACSSPKSVISTEVARANGAAKWRNPIIINIFHDTQELIFKKQPKNRLSSPQTQKAKSRNPPTNSNQTTSSTKINFLESAF
jgi:hypothetical protein